jgi:hypothetical protein
MPIAYTYDAVRGLSHTVVTGRITPDEAATYFTQISQEDWFPAPSLTDAREASPNLSGEEIRAITKHFRSIETTLTSVPLAVLVSSEVAFGLVRMVGLLLDDAAMIHPFRDLERAMQWLTPHLRAA